MAKSWWYRFSLLVVIMCFAVGSILPTVLKDVKLPFGKKINMGLDLQGGLYMVLGIDFNKVYQEEVTTYSKKVQDYLKGEGIEVTLGDLITTDPTDPHYSLILASAGEADKVKAKIQEFFSYPLRLVSEDKEKLVYGMGRDFKKEIESTAVSKSIEVIRNRIDEFGVTEPEIISQGQDRIVVQLPGVKDIEHAKDLIGKTAKLEFRFVNDETPQSTLNDWIEKAKAGGITFTKGQRFSEYVAKLNEFLAADLPKGFQIFFTKEMGLDNEVKNLEPYLLETRFKSN